MKIQMRKLMAVVCAVAMIVSCMAVVSVSAAVQAYTWTFASAENNSNYWGTGTGDSSNNSQGGDYFTTVTSGEGYNGSDRYIRMAYTGNLTTVTNPNTPASGWSVLSLPNNCGQYMDGRNPGQTAHLLQGITYKVTVAYKVINAPVDAELRMDVGLGNLAGGANAYGSNTYCGTLATIAAGEVSSDWVVKVTTVTPPQKQGVYVSLAPADNTMRSGLEVQLGYVAVEQAPAGIDITLDYNGGGAVVSEVVNGVPGVSDLPHAASPSGYEFLGWNTQADGQGETVTKWPEIAGTTVYAQWNKNVDAYSVEVKDFSRDEYINKSGNGNTNGSITHVRPANSSGTGGWFGSVVRSENGAIVMGNEVFSASDNALSTTAGFRLLSDTAESFGGTGDSQLIPNAYYLVEFDYSITSIGTKPLALQVAVGDVTWAQQTINSSAPGLYINYSKNNPDMVYDTGVLTDAVKADRAQVVIATGDADNYLNIALNNNGANGTDRGNTWVTIDNVKLTLMAAVVVDFKGNDGADSEDFTDTGIPAASALPTPTHIRGYEFLGWNTQADGQGEAVTEWPAEATTVYAQWDKSAGTRYIVTYDAMAGKLQGAAQQVGLAGEALAGTTAYAPYGFKFAGWADAEGNAVTTIPEGDATVYAKYEQTLIFNHTVGVQDFEGTTIDQFIHATNTSSADMTIDNTNNRTSVGQSAMHATIRQGTNGQRTRPRLVLQEEGENVVVKNGDKVTVSFWLYSAREMSQMTFWISTMDAATAEDHITATSGGAGVCHQMQTINTLNGASHSGTDTTQRVHPAGEWVQYTAVINSIDDDNDAVDNYLALGVTDNATYMSGYQENEYWIDDIIVLINDEQAPVETGAFEKSEGTLTFEDVATGTYGYGPFGSAVVEGISHDGGNKALKITQNSGDSGANRAYIPITSEAVVEGKQYLVSFWVYAPTAHKPGIRYWLAPNAVGNAFANGTAKDAVKVAEGYAIRDTETVDDWKRITVLTNAVKTDTANVLTLGISDDAIANRRASSSTFYVDDISVVDVSTLKQEAISGNVAVYDDGASYEYEPGKAAMRYLAGYKTTNLACDNIILGGVDYALSERGLIFGNEDMSMIKGGNEEGAGVAGTDYLHWVYVNSGTDGGYAKCWNRDASGNIQYSFYVKGVTEATHATTFAFRSYIAVTVEVPTADMAGTTTSKLVIYGDTLKVSYDDVFAAAAPGQANPFAG